MTNPRNLIGTAVLAVALATVGAGCSKPDANPPVQYTGNPAKAIPPTSSTTSTTSSTTTTTLYYAAH